MSNMFIKRRKRDSYRYNKTDKHILGVFRSNKHLTAYVSQDKSVLFSVSSMSKSVPAELKNKNNLQTAEWIGKTIADKLSELQISEVVFNKSGYKFHGRVEGIAKAVRERGIKC